MTAVLPLILALASIPYAHAADTEKAVEVLARVSPESPTIGTPFRYEVEVVGPAGVEIVVAQPSERIGPFDILDFGTEPAVVSDDARVSFKRWWKLVAWSPGSHSLPSPEVRYRFPDEDLQVATAADTTVEIASVLAAESETPDIKDIKPPKPVPPDLRPYYALAALAAIVAAAILASRWLRARRRRRPLVFPRPPHQVALEALDSLRGRKLPQQGSFKEFYSSLSDIVRAYMEARFGLRAPEMTTEEFLVATARDFQLAVPHRRLLGTFLAESDLVKFARHHPTLDDSESAFIAARRFVTETIDDPMEARRALG